MLADLLTDTAEKHKQSAALVVSNREVIVFSFCLLIYFAASVLGGAVRRRVSVCLKIADKAASVAIPPYYFLPSAYNTARSLCFGRLALAGAYALRVPPQVKHLGLFTPILPADKGEDQFGFLG